VDGTGLGSCLLVRLFCSASELLLLLQGWVTWLPSLLKFYMHSET